MGNYTYDATEPAANSNPTNSQPTMLVNAASIASIIAQDHVGFSTDDGGYHKQISFNGNNIPGGAPSTVESFVYTDAGTANAAANLFLKNEVGTFPISLLKATGSFTASSGTATFLAQYNCATIAESTGTFTITLTTTATTTNSVIVFVNSSNITGILFIPKWTFASNVLTITNTGLATAATISFAVLQV